MSSWFKRKDKGIHTLTEDKKDVPKGLWYKTPSGKVVDTDELKENYYVSPEDGYHVRIGSREYFEILFDAIQDQLNLVHRINLLLAIYDLVQKVSSPVNVQC